MLGQANPEALVSTAKNIADQSDRVMFVIILGILLGGTAWLMKMFISSNNKKDEQLVALMRETNDTNRKLAGAVDDLSEHVKDSAEIMRGVKTKLNLAVVAFLGFASLLLLGGCAKFSGTSERHFEGTNVVSEVVRFRGYTLFDANATLAKAKSSQTKTTLAVGVDASQQESTGKSVVDAIEKMGEAVPNIIRNSVVPVP